MEERLALTELIETLGRQITVVLRQPSVDSVSPVAVADRSARSQALQLVLSALKEWVPYDSASVQELRGGKLVIVGGVGFADLDVIIGESFDIDSIDAPNGEVIYRGRPLIVRDTEHYRAFRRGLHVGAGIRSWLGVPLVHGGTLLGMVALDKQEADFFTTEHQNVATLFASLAAQAMVAGSDPRRRDQDRAPDKG